MTSFEELRALGLNIIPCLPKSKKPKVDWFEYKNTKYTGELGTDNAAVMCGITSGNLVVIDVDRKELITKFFANFEGLKTATLVVETGKGYHIYCHPKGNMIPIIKLIDSNNQPVGELRGQGGYVMAAGSIHDVTGKEYKIISSTTNINEVDLDALLTNLKVVGIHPQGILPLTELIKEVPIGNRDNATFKYAATLISAGLEYEGVLEAVKIWSKQLGFAKVHISAVKSAWKRVKRPETLQKLEPLTFTRMKDLKNVKVGDIVTFDALIAVTDEIRQVITEIEAKCPKCDNTELIEGNGYSNPIYPECINCKIKMKWVYKSMKTENIMDVMIEEFLEEANHNSPMRYDGLVSGKDVFNTFSGQRKGITAKYRSIPERDPRDGNKILLQVQDLEDLGEPEDEVLTPKEVENLTNILNTDPQALQKIVNSFAHHVECDSEIREILLLSLLCGSEDVIRRIQSHIFIIGDPSKGKSELLKSILEVVGKSTYIIGMSTSKAGLASGMVKINGRMMPRAGVLARYTNGVVICDEFDKMQKEDQNGALECMEQQTVSLAKAGVEEHLEAKTTIIAAANPKFGTWDSDLDILENVNLSAFMLQRFDIIVRMGDEGEQQRRKVGMKILKMDNKPKEKLFENTRDLKRYLNYARKLKPTISSSSKTKLLDFYERMSKPTSDKRTLPMQARQLEGMIRITTEVAKSKLKAEADESDVDECIRLYKYSLESFGIDTSQGVQQFRMEDFKLGKEQELLECIHKCMDEDAEFTSIDVIQSWAKTNHFKSTESAEREFKKWLGEKILLAKSGFYKLSRLN